MNKYEKLKYICDTIGYRSDNIIFKNRDEREIIFTQEFFNKFKMYVFDGKTDVDIHIFYIDVLYELDNPVDLLYKYIIGKQTQ